MNYALPAGTAGFSQGLEDSRRDELARIAVLQHMQQSQLFPLQYGLLGEQLKAAQQQNVNRGLLPGAIEQFAGLLSHRALAAQQQNPMVPGQPGSSVMAGAPGTTPPAPSAAPAPPQQAAGPDQAAIFRQLANLKALGFDLSDVYKASQRNVQTSPSGVQYDQHSGEVIGSLPVVSEAFGGYQMNRGPGGGFNMAALPGSDLMRRQQLTTGEQVKAQFAPATVTIGGRPIETTQAIANAISTGMAQDEQTALAANQTLLRNGELGSVGVVGAGQAASLSTARPAPALLPPGTRRSPPEAASEEEFARGKAKEAVAESAKFREAYFQGQSTRGNLDLLQSIFSNPNVASGSLAESITGLKGVADSFGINVAGKGYEDVARAIGGEMALRMKNQGGVNLMPGAMSNFEQNLLRQMSPGLAQSREGRMLLTQVFKAKVDRDIALSELAARYEDQNGKLDAGFYRQARQYVRDNPMFTEDRVKAMTEYARRLTSGQ